MIGVARRIALGILALLAAGPVTRAAIDTPLPPHFIAALAVLGALAARSPLHGLLVLCGLLPLASMIGVLARVPWYGTQTALALSLAFLTGLLLNATKRGTLGLPPRVAIPLALYAALIVASAAATSIAGATSLGTWEGLRALTAMDYLQVPSPQQPALFAFDALVGLGLFMAVLSVRDERLERPVVRMLVAGLTAAAALNVLRFTQAVIASGDPAAAISRYAQSLRINVHYADLNAAASTFALALLAAVGLACAGGSRLERSSFAGCVIVLGVALWLAGSRVAIASAVLAAAAVISFGLFATRKAWSRPAAWLLSGAAFLLAGLIAVWMVASFPRVQANTDPASALAIRLELLSRAGRMIADAPLLGIGVGRFYAESFRYSTPRSFGPENSHNMFAQVAAELGLLGLAAFVWLIGASLLPLARGVRPGITPLILWTCGGILAYMLSGLGGHPLIVFEAAVPFWIALGVAAGAMATGPVKGDSAIPRRLRLAMLAVAALLAISIPLRAGQFIRWRHLNEVSDASWLIDETTRYRDVGQEDVIFVPPPYASVMLPMRLTSPSQDYGEVLVTLDGVPANRFVVRSDAWTTVRLRLPVAKGYDDRRVELKLEDAPPGARLLVGRVSPEK